MTMTFSPVVQTVLATREGCAKLRPDGRLDAYPDPYSPMGRGVYPTCGADVSKGAPWTIGFGSTGPTITRGTVWTMEQAELDLANRLTSKSATLARYLAGGAPTSQCQFDAMLMLMDNIGGANFHGSDCLAHHRAGRYDDAALDFGNWVHAQGVWSLGLARRRAFESTWYAGGDMAACNAASVAVATAAAEGTTRKPRK